MFKRKIKINNTPDKNRTPKLDDDHVEEITSKLWIDSSDDRYIIKDTNPWRNEIFNLLNCDIFKINHFPFRGKEIPALIIGVDIDHSILIAICIGSEPCDCMKMRIRLNSIRTPRFGDTVFVDKSDNSDDGYQLLSYAVDNIRDYIERLFQITRIIFITPLDTDNVRNNFICISSTVRLNKNLTLNDHLIKIGCAKPYKKDAKYSWSREELININNVSKMK